MRRRTVMRWAFLGCFIVLVSAGAARGGDAVDCAERFPVGRFALTQKDASLFIGHLADFALVHLLKKPVLLPASGPEDPCELVYGFDVFEFTVARAPGALIAGCTGDFRGDGAHDYVVLLRRNIDGRYIPHVFLARGHTFDVVQLEAHATDDSIWFGPFCQPKPRTGVFQAPDFEGTGQGAQIPVVGDLITVGWWTYYWRPDLNRFDAILTTD